MLTPNDSSGSLHSLIKEALTRAKTIPGSQTLICPAPRNVITDRKYTGSNILTLSLCATGRDFPTNQWQTENQIAANGGTVKSGEHPTFISKASPIYNKGTKPLRGTLSAQTSNNAKQRINYTRYPLYNVHQVTGLSWGLYGKQFDRSSQTSEAVESILLVSGLNIRYGGNVCRYDRNTKAINLPEGFNPDNTADGASALQELIKSVCNHVKVPARYSNLDNYRSLTDLVAAIGACFLTCHLIDTFSLVINERFIDDWLFFIKLDEKILFRAIAEAGRSANELLAKMDFFK